MEINLPPKEIPVINLKGKPDYYENPEIVQEIHSAFSSIGFVYLTNHGVDLEKINRAFESSRKFFELPFDSKKKYPRVPGIFQGYVAPNQEILEASSSLEIREAFDVKSPDIDYFPEEVPEFKKAISNLYPDVVECTKQLLRAVAVALGQDKDFFINNHKDIGSSGNHTLFRTLYYPPLKEEDIQPDVMRCGEHTDYGTFTLLFQDSIGGLEVLTKDKRWIQAQPIPGSILVNVADLLQIWTDDDYPATMHRVRIPADEFQRRSIRQSIAFFVHPDHEFPVMPLNGNTTNYKTPTNSDIWTKMKLDASYKY